MKGDASCQYSDMNINTFNFVQTPCYGSHGICIVDYTQCLFSVRTWKDETHGYIVMSSVPVLIVYRTDIAGCDSKAIVVNLLLVRRVSASSALFAAMRIMIRLNAMQITVVFYQRRNTQLAFPLELTPKRILTIVPIIWIAKLL
jgi:hypothetical protein